MASKKPNATYSSMKAVRETFFPNRIRDKQRLMERHVDSTELADQFVRAVADRMKGTRVAKSSSTR